MSDPEKERLDALLEAVANTRTEVGRAVLGLTDVIDQIMIALICGGHVLLEGTPGVGKTLLIRSIGAATGLSFGRIQFTPDLLPADITGGLVLTPDDSGQMRAQFQAGPVFHQIVLADEINRATPKTQSSLLEAMQEGTVTVGGDSMKLPQPFFVLATQNPVEMEGTYILPEAQIDRFLFKSLVRYPDVAELDAILDLTTGAESALPEQVLSAEDILELQRIVRAVPIADHVRRAVAQLSLNTQPSRSEAPEEVRSFIRFGLSPRGAQSLVLAAKGHALLRGRYNVAFEDLSAVLLPVMRHRVQLNFQGETEGVDIDALIAGLLEREVRLAS